MAITADLGGKNYVLGKGKVYFDRFANNISVTANTRGEGERYLGNAPEFSTTSSAENLEHYASDGGLRVKDSSVQLSIDRTGKVVVDNIDADNIALFFQGTAATVIAAGSTGVVETISVKKGKFYQLGVSASVPAGVRKVSNVVVKKGSPGFATTVTQVGNYEVDADLGRIYIESASADIPDDTVIQITYDVQASSRIQVVSSNNAIYGALRFVADNPVGVNRDFYLPYVKFAPDGDYNLIGEEWQQIGFTFEILKKASNIESMYIDGRPA